MKHLSVALAATVSFLIVTTSASLAQPSPTPAASAPVSATPSPIMSPTPLPSLQAAPPVQQTPVPMAPTLPPMEFGNPPSGEIPILFNDRHVYARPDTLRQGRVLAALVKNGTLLVPLRSMFEQMGSTVSYDAASKSVTASKPGSQVQVTLGKSEVVINGETRPLDVPPIMYKGVLLVPIRVISEALGAYVQWVPQQRLAVVRYIPPTPVPTPPPATPAPTPAPTPSPKPSTLLGYIEGGYAFSTVYNNYAAGGSGGSYKGASYVAQGAYLFEKFAIKVDWRQDQFKSANNAPDAAGNPFTMFNTIDGGTSTVAQFLGRNSTLDGRLEYQIAKPHIYFGLGYIQASNNYGDPSVTAGGFGLEKLPDFTGGLGWFGSIFWYPNTRGTYSIPTGPTAGLNFTTAYEIYKYDVGINYEFGHSPFYTYAGFSGDKYVRKQASPSSQTHSGPYLGFGVKF